MERTQAEKDIRLIRDIMERSTKYTHFSGLSGIIAGVLSLVGCFVTAAIWVALPHRYVEQNKWYFLTWVTVLVLAVAQDLLRARYKARKSGQTLWSPSTRQAMIALMPGVLLGFVLSLKALVLSEYDAIPILWILGYGTALASAGMFSIREMRIFGWVQIATGSVALFVVDMLPTAALGRFSLGLVALAFGLYHVIYGIALSRKYGW